MNEPSHHEPPAIAWWQILIAAVVGLIVLVGVGYLAWELAGRPAYGQWSDLARSVPLIFAAVGAVPAGYIAYRRQRTLEIQRLDDREKLALADGTEQRLREAEGVRRQELTDAYQRADARDFQARYTEVATQLGSDKAPIRLAGVHATGKLIDDWGSFDPSQRQMCVDLLCGYMCLPLAAPASNPALPPEPATTPESVDAELRVREALVRLLKQHLARRGSNWHGLTFDFTGARFPKGHWDFSGANFNGGALKLTRAIFDKGATVTFAGAEFTGGATDFRHAKFLAGSEVDFTGVTLARDQDVTFDHAGFAGAIVNFGAATICTPVAFRAIALSGGNLNFGGATLTAKGAIAFDGATLSAGLINLNGAVLAEGATITFDEVTFVGGSVTLQRATIPNGAVTSDGRPFGGAGPEFSPA